MTTTQEPLPLAYPHVPAQQFTQRYSDEDAIIRGTLFPELDLPFGEFAITQHLPNTPMTNLMKIDFVCHELRLYLDVHPNDANAQKLYTLYTKKSKEANNAAFASHDWVNDPWPWE